MSRRPTGKYTFRRRTLTRRAGLVFPVRRIHRRLRSHNSGRMRVREMAAVYFAAVLEYLATELMELSGNVCHDLAKRRVTPRHLMLAIRVDHDIEPMLKRVIIPAAGVLPEFVPGKWMIGERHEGLVRPREVMYGGAGANCEPPPPPPPTQKKAAKKAAAKRRSAAHTGKAARPPHCALCCARRALATTGAQAATHIQLSRVELKQCVCVCVSPDPDGYARPLAE